MRRLRVGVVVPGWSGPSGPAALPALQDLLWALAPDQDLRIVALRHPAHAGGYRDAAGIPVVSLGAGSRAGPVGRAAVLAAGIRAVRRLHEAAPFDVLHGFWADEPGMLATVAGRLLGRRAIVSVMGGELAALPDIGYGAALGRGGRLSVGLALRSADLVTVGSAEMFGEVGRQRPDVPLRLLPLGVDLDRFAPGRDPDRRATSGPPRILFAGSLVPVKDPVLLVRAFARIEDRGVGLDIAGDGPLRPGLERLATVLGVADRVRFLGAVPRAELPPLMRAAGVLALTSRHEAQSMVAVEAAATARAVVGPAVGVVPELARAGGAVVVTERRPVVLATALEHALEDGVREGLGSAARAHAVHAWSLAMAVGRVSAAWHELAAEPDAT